MTSEVHLNSRQRSLGGYAFPVYVTHLSTSISDQRDQLFSYGIFGYFRAQGSGALWALFEDSPLAPCSDVKQSWFHMEEGKI